MKKSVRDVLDVIDNALCELPKREATHLWDILTALRGPDMPGTAVFKATTTSHIRAFAFPRTAREIHEVSKRGRGRPPVPADFASEPVTDGLITCAAEVCNHFGSHVEFALWAINAKEEEEGEDE